MIFVLNLNISVHKSGQVGPMFNMISLRSALKNDRQNMQQREPLLSNLYNQDFLISQ